MVTVKTKMQLISQILEGYSLLTAICLILSFLIIRFFFKSTQLQAQMIENDEKESQIHNLKQKLGEDNERIEYLEKRLNDLESENTNLKELNSLMLH